MHALFTFFPVSAVQKLLKLVKIWKTCSHMYTATFYEPRQKCRFWFFQVRCAHKSDDVINFIRVVCRISLRLKWYKNYRNRLRLAKVIVKNKMSRFYGSLYRMQEIITSVASRHATSANSLSAFRQQLKHTLFLQSFPDIIMWHFSTVTSPIVVLAVALLLRPL